MTEKLARYREQLQKCSAEIRELLPELAHRHTPLVVVAALTEHLGGALFLSQEVRACSPARARAIIRRVTRIAFADSKTTDGSVPPG
ncbi:MAG: hypothetical protein JWN85_4064 [Gammaproteobacteria bacterium]|nr:hypothetical protein [Gammaproteobacteria bacterium]